VNRDKRISANAKLVLLGNSGVGKSSIVSRYINKRFSDNAEVTVGVGYYHQKLKLNDGSTLNLDIWDTGGQERYRALMPLYYREAAAAVICYDVSNYSSFEACEYWYRELRQGEPNCLIFLVGNKDDIPAKRVDSRIAEDYAKARNMHWIEASAKTGANILQLFKDISETIVSKKKGAKETV
jgi:small GTP-binding protein